MTYKNPTVLDCCLVLNILQRGSAFCFQFCEPKASTLIIVLVFSSCQEQDQAYVLYLTLLQNVLPIQLGVMLMKDALLAADAVCRVIALENVSKQR